MNLVHSLNIYVVLHARIGMCTISCLSCLPLILSFLPVLGEKLRNPEEVLRYELQCLESLGQWSQLVSRLVPVIKEQPDHWSHLKLYITSQVHRTKTENEASNGTEVESGKGEGQGAESPLDEMASVLNQLVLAEDGKKSKRLRGPYLSVLEAVRQLKEVSLPFDKCKKYMQNDMQQV